MCGGAGVCAQAKEGGIGEIGERWVIGNELRLEEGALV